MPVLQLLTDPLIPRRHCQCGSRHAGDRVQGTGLPSVASVLRPAQGLPSRGPVGTDLAVEGWLQSVLLLPLRAGAPSLRSAPATSPVS